MQIQAVYSSDPIFVSQLSASGNIELRVGESEPGVTRLAYLTPKLARAVVIRAASNR